MTAPHRTAAGAGVTVTPPAATSRHGTGGAAGVTVTPTPADDGEVAAIVAAVRLLLARAEPTRSAPARSGWRFAGRWWR